jgi:hypothetical protein
MPWLWVPALVFAHVFAGAWVCRTLLLGKRHWKKSGVNPVCSISANTEKSPSRIGDPGNPNSTVAQATPQQLSGTSPERNVWSAAGHSLPSYTQRTGGNRTNAVSVSSSAVDVEAAADAGWSPRISSQCKDSDFAAVGGTAASCCTQALAEIRWSRVGCIYKAHGCDKVVLQDVWGAALSSEVQVRLRCC